MKLTIEEAKEVVYGDSVNFEEVKGTEEIIGKSRWAISKQAIFRYNPTNSCYLFNWQEGSTECQDDTEPFYGDYYEPVEVELKEVVVKKWVPIKEQK